MKRGGTVLAMAVLFSLGLSPAAAQDGTGTADVYLKQKGDDYYAGEDLLSADGVGQSRSLLIEDRLVLVVKIENDDTRPVKVVIRGSRSASGFDVRYLFRGVNVTDLVTADEVSSDDQLFGQRVKPGRSKELRVIVEVADSALLGAVQDVVVTAVVPGGVDTARAEITKIS